MSSLVSAARVAAVTTPPEDRQITALTIISTEDTNSRQSGDLSRWVGEVDIDGQAERIDVRCRVGERPIVIDSGALVLPDDEVEQITSDVRVRRQGAANIEAERSRALADLIADFRAQAEEGREQMPERAAILDRILDEISEDDLRFSAHRLESIIEDRFRRACR